MDCQTPGHLTQVIMTLTGPGVATKSSFLYHYFKSNKETAITTCKPTFLDQRRDTTMIQSAVEKAQSCFASFSMFSFLLNIEAPSFTLRSPALAPI